MSEENFVRVTLLPTWGLREMMSMADSALPDDLRPVLVDATGLQGVGPVEHAVMGEHVAMVMPLRRIAVVIQESAASYNSERAAQQAGVNLRVFTREDAALAWLAATDGPRD